QSNTDHHDVLSTGADPSLVVPQSSWEPSFSELTCAPWALTTYHCTVRACPVLIALVSALLCLIVSGSITAGLLSIPGFHERDSVGSYIWSSGLGSTLDSPRC